MLHHENAHIDFLFYTNLKLKLQNQLKENTAEPETISIFLKILKNGNILPNLEHEWLDPHKSSISDEVISLLQEVLTLPVIHIQIDLKIEVAKTIFQFDQLNEEALKSILIALSSQGNHGQAHQVYDEFGKKYTAIYEEEYPLSFTEIIKN